MHATRRRKGEDKTRSDPSLINIPPPPGYPPPAAPSGTKATKPVTYDRNYASKDRKPASKMPTASIVLQTVIILTLVSSVALLPSSYLLLVIVVCGGILAVLLYLYRPSSDEEEDLSDLSEDELADNDIESASEAGDAVPGNHSDFGFQRGDRIDSSTSHTIAASTSK